MNPAVHVLIECFLCGLKFAPHNPLRGSCVPSSSVPTSPCPSPPPLVCEAAHWWLMNKGSLTSHFPHESSRVCKQTNTSGQTEPAHKNKRRGNGSVATFYTKLPLKKINKKNCILLPGKRSILLWEGWVRNPKDFFFFLKAQHSLENILSSGWKPEGCATKNSWFFFHC